RVHPAGVGDDLEPRLALEDRAEPIQYIEKIGGKSRPRVAFFLQGQDRHGQLGQVFERQVVKPALFGQEDGGIEVVAPETAAVADPYRVQASFSSCSRSRTPLPGYPPRGLEHNPLLLIGRQGGQGESQPAAAQELRYIDKLLNGMHV